MRISIDPTDPGFSETGFLTRVLLDGNELHRCITADEELGEAICWGDHVRHDIIERVTLRGKVTIILPA